MNLAKKAVEGSSDLRYEFDFMRSKTTQILRAFMRTGCVLIRNMVEVEAIEKVKCDTSEMYDSDKSMISNSEIHDKKGYYFSDVLLSERARAMLKKAFQGHPFNATPGTHTRIVTVPSGTANHDDGALGYHLDCMFQGFEFTENFWVPFDDCGDHAPSLAVIPMPFSEVKAFTGFDGRPSDYGPHGVWHFNHFNPLMRAAAERDQRANSEIQANFGTRIWKPIYKVGDVMMISNWTLHGTHIHPGMTKGRQNVEMRFASANVSLERAIKLHRRPWAKIRSAIFD